MEMSQIIILTIGAIFLVALVACYLLKKDYMKYSKALTPILNALLAVVKAVGGIVPDQGVLNIAATAISAAIEAAGYAENLWLQGEIDKTMRPKYAQEYIESTLTKAGIEVTDSIQSMISGAISLACYLMPHYSTKEE